MRQRLSGLAEQVASLETDSYRATLEAFIYTVLLSAPLPLALKVASDLLSTTNASAYVYSASEALRHLASIAGVLELARQLLVPDGLAEAHFGWPRKITRRIHRGLLWREIVFLPLIYVAIQMGGAGMRLDSPDALQAYNNSFGRLIFFIATVVLGISLLALFRPRQRRHLIDEADKRWLWAHRLYMYAYPVIVLGTIVPALLAILGFYITGYLLSFQMLHMVWLLTFVMILGGMLSRWNATSHESRAAGDDAQPQEASAQIRQLFRFVLILVMFIGTYSIWSQAVPGLQIMKRIQIWPRIVLLEGGRDDLLPASTAAEPASTVAATPAPAEGAAAVPAVPGMVMPTDASGDDRDPAESSPLTLWKLGESLLAVAITLMLVRNVPGLLELTLRKKKVLDSGARIAVSTLIRYTLMILGMSIAFGLLGISWTKIQWLAAALTFGLGFGLQEIVANFVSGLILLTERPIRVGDAVTIGNLQGRVSRIQIRATTVAMWDQSEMIVPNKEFVTAKLINWTLSDSRRRIEIPLRVAYGANLEKVKEVLLRVATDHPDVLRDPPPQALLLEFGDDALKFELRYFVDFGMGLRTRDELHMRVDHAFREAGIEFALPRLNIEIPRRGSR
jgi:potassium efflux system protein